MQYISDNLPADVLWGLVPGQLQAAGAEGPGLEAGGGLWQFGPLADGEAGAGLVCTGAVLSNALIDGLILGRDPGDGECPAEGDKEKFTSPQFSQTLAVNFIGEKHCLSSYVFPLVSLTLPLGISSLPFFSQIR